MKMKSIIAIFLLLSIFLVIGCTDDNSNEKAINKYEEEKGVMDVTVGKTFNYESKLTEQNQERLVEAVPPPELLNSLERQNIKRRYGLLNDNNKIFYIYLIDYGKVMAYYTVSGKMSSVNSRITQEEQIVADPACLKESYYNGGGSDKDCYFVVGSPQLDGSYGTNGNGIFFFTTEGAYIEWNGVYQVSDQPLEMSTPPVLIMNVN